MVQQWWNVFVRWFNSDAGQTVVTSAIIPFIAIVVGGIFAAMIARGAIKRLLTQQERQQKAAAVATLIAAGRRAATWSTLSAPEKDHIDHQSSEAEVRVRLLPIRGATLAADWAAHQLATMKRNSTNYTFQAEQDLADFQDGLIAWQAKPSRAKKLFSQDLATWKYETPAEPTADEQLATRQREWSTSQHPAPLHAAAEVAAPAPAIYIPAAAAAAAAPAPAPAPASFVSPSFVPPSYDASPTTATTVLPHRTGE